MVNIQIIFVDDVVLIAKDKEELHTMIEELDC